MIPLSRGWSITVLIFGVLLTSLNVSVVMRGEANPLTFILIVAWAAIMWVEIRNLDRSGKEKK